MKKFLFDLFPLILFFVAYRLADLYVGKGSAIYVATGIAIVASILQILWLRLTRRAIEATHWINVSIITVFGGATILLHDDTFIKWKPTVLYWLFAAILLGSRLLTGRNLMRRLMGDKIALTEHAWSRLNDSWAGFFLLSGFLNLYVAFSGQFTESQWVNFKVFGLTVLLLLFVVVQSLWLGRHIQANDPADAQTGAGVRAEEAPGERPAALDRATALADKAAAPGRGTAPGRGAAPDRAAAADGSPTDTPTRGPQADPRH